MEPLKIVKEYLGYLSLTDFENPLPLMGYAPDGWEHKEKHVFPRELSSKNILPIEIRLAATTRRHHVLLFTTSGEIVVCSYPDDGPCIFLSPYEGTPRLFLEEAIRIVQTLEAARERAESYHRKKVAGLSCYGEKRSAALGRLKTLLNERAPDLDETVLR